MHKIEHVDFSCETQELAADAAVEDHMTETTTTTTTAPVPTCAMHVPASNPLPPSPHDDEGDGPVFTSEELKRMAILREDDHCLSAGGSGRRFFEVAMQPTVQADEV